MQRMMQGRGSEMCFRDVIVTFVSTRNGSGTFSLYLSSPTVYFCGLSKETKYNNRY